MNKSKDQPQTQEPNHVASSDGLGRDRMKEIFITVRIEALRKTVAEVQGDVLPEDIAARDAILDALKRQGYEVLAVGEGRAADAWVKKSELADAEVIAANRKLLAKRMALGIAA